MRRQLKTDVEYLRSQASQFKRFMNDNRRDRSNRRNEPELIRRQVETSSKDYDDRHKRNGSKSRPRTRRPATSPEASKPRVKNEDYIPNTYGNSFWDDSPTSTHNPHSADPEDAPEQSQNSNFQQPHPLYHQGEPSQPQPEEGRVQKSRLRNLRSRSRASFKDTTNDKNVQRETRDRTHSDDSDSSYESSTSPRRSRGRSEMRERTDSRRDDRMYEDDKENEPSVARNSHSKKPPSSAAAIEFDPNDPNAQFAIPQEGEVVKEERRACAHCGRKFNIKALSRHEPRCKTQQAKNKERKRKKYNMVAKRLDGTAMTSEDKQIVKEALRNKNKPDKKKKKNNWKAQSAQLRQVMGAGKPGGDDGFEVAPPPDDRVECPHCSRKFNETAAERHIPKCANIRSKPKSLSRKKYKYGVKKR